VSHGVERPFEHLYRYLALIAVAFFVLTPMLATLLGGFKTLGELRTDPFGLPDRLYLDNYAVILSDPTLWRLLLNSALIALATVALTLVVGAMAAYVFAQITFFGSRMLLSYLLLGLMFPFATAILPLFIRLRDFGLLDSRLGIILPQVAFGLAFSVVLMRGFFRQLPPELWDAARVDGCGYARFFWSVTLPLSTPILATVGVFTLVQSWNNFLLPLVVLNDESLHTWPLGIMQFQGEFSTEWTLVLAFVTLTLLPAVVFFALAQRYIIAGLTGGAVKA
jgi:raffinose/stachyose/melibiose transport system permease protein